ncbi:hypothetical protein BKA70DRAFT_541658 [Coprinopsis sp. MPI-PUGE-AT-0042]|nr:hypothetical protein BKA70DRAFT_541658 [Coprinopsis sp. MPI-PUGE-AT-0042]
MPVTSSSSRSWITLWFVASLPVILWDASYCFMRPRSMTGGDLHFLWKPYELWEEVDHVYGWPSFNRGDGFTNAQSLMNLIETVGNLYYVYLQRNGEPTAPLVGFTAASLTLAKTVLYWAQEYYCDYCAIGHNSVDKLALWAVLNGLWIVVPAVIVYQLGGDLSRSLRVAARAGGSAKKVKAT